MKPQMNRLSEKRLSIWTGVFLAPQKLAPQKLAPQKLAPQKLAPQKLAPQKLAPQKLARQKLAPQKLALPYALLNRAALHDWIHALSAPPILAFDLTYPLTGKEGFCYISINTK
nr:hypothetical protein [Paenibacillus sp. RU4T]